MRFLSWIGGLFLILLIGTGAGMALRAHSNGTQTLAAALPAATASPSPFETPQDVPSPSPPPTAVKAVTAPPQKKAAAPAPRPAPPRIVIGSTQQALINQDRARAGLKPLTWSSCLAGVARINASRLARQGWVPPYHTDGPTRDLACRLGNHAGENVGYWSGGINDAQLNTMFMNSPEHRANIVGGYYHYVGTAWVVAADGKAYIAVEFS